MRNNHGNNAQLAVDSITRMAYTYRYTVYVLPTGLHTNGEHRVSCEPCEERQTQLEFLEPRQHEAAGMARLARHGMEQCARRHDAMGWSGGTAARLISSCPSCRPATASKRARVNELASRQGPRDPLFARFAFSRACRCFLFYFVLFLCFLNALAHLYGLLVYIHPIHPIHIIGNIFNTFDSQIRR